MQVLNFRHTRPTSNTLLQPKNYLYGCYKAVKWSDTILIPFYLVSVTYVYLQTFGIEFAPTILSSLPIPCIIVWIVLLFIYGVKITI